MTAASRRRLQAASDSLIASWRGTAAATTSTGGTAVQLSLFDLVEQWRLRR